MCSLGASSAGLEIELLFSLVIPPSCFDSLPYVGTKSLVKVAKTASFRYGEVVSFVWDVFRAPFHHSYF